MLDRTIAPDFSRNIQFNLITPDHVKLPSGAEIYFVAGGDQNVIKVELVYKAGRWHEKIWGTSHFTSTLLTKGTKTKTSFEIASLFDQQGAHLDIHAGVDFITIGLYSLTKRLDSSLQLLAEILNQPVFPEKELQQSQAIYLQNLKVNKEKTSFLASHLFRKTLFGDEHPYGKELSEEDVQNLKQQDLVNFHKNQLTNFTVFVSGKVSEESKKQIIKCFESFQFSPGTDQAHTISATLPSNIYKEKEESIQTSLRICKGTILRSHPDYPLLLFLNHIFGGYFGSRLMKNIREDKGLTYGIYSSLHAMKHSSYLVIGTDVNKENREVAFLEIRKEIQRLRSEEIPSEELDTAKWHFIGSLQTELSTSFAHADKVKNMVLMNLPEDYYTLLIKKISNADASELMHLANKYFQEKDFFEIAVG